MNNEKETLEEAKKLVHYISLQDRVAQLHVTLSGLQDLETRIRTNAKVIFLKELAGEEITEDMEMSQERLKESLRCIKNSVTIQSLIIYKQSQKEL